MRPAKIAPRERPIHGYIAVEPLGTSPQRVSRCYRFRLAIELADDDLHDLSQRLLALTQKVEAEEDVQALAKQVLALTGKVEAVEARMMIVERLETQLEESALQTTRALEEISRHWDAVVTALRRESERERE